MQNSLHVAVINAGSSSLKYKLIEYPSCEVLESKNIEKIGEPGGVANHHEALKKLGLDFEKIDIVGHRVVHGGELFEASVALNAEVIEQLQSLIPLAPLHNPANIEAIQACMLKAPQALHVAVFDTAFHATMPKEAYIYALPWELYAKNHIRRYGFHGSSYAYLTHKAAEILQKEKPNLIILHLGNGASACAVKEGKSIDTSMGFTPLEGLVMGTRCGDIDPQIVLHLQRELGMDAQEVDTLLNKKSGLFGLCGSNDMREILLREDAKAQLAVEITVRRIQKYIGAYMVLLEGEVDALVFSGGIGENAELIRQKVLENAMFENLNTLVIQTDEELQIVLESVKVYGLTK